MNWPFWSLSRPADGSSCESIELLLSLYADGMASSEEVRRVESHLPGCEDCRAALSWMQATHRALAARPIVVPPAGLQSRIAEAIASSSAAPISLRPTRSFTLRPAYAAAVSLSVLGIALSYSLWHSPSVVPAKHLTAPPRTASAPVAKLPTKAGVVAKHTLHLGRRTEPPLVASNLPHAVKPGSMKHVPALRQTDPLEAPISQERIAKAVFVPAPLVVQPVHPVVKAVIHRLPLPAQMASSRLTHSEVRQPAVIKQNKSPEPPQLASRPQPIVPVTILPSTVTTAPPLVQTASISTSPSAKISDILGPVRAHIGLMQSVALVTTRQSYRGAATVMRTLDTEHTAYVDAIHTP